MRATKPTWGDPLIVPTLPIFRAAFLYMSRLVAKTAAANFSPFAKLLPVSNVIILFVQILHFYSSSSRCCPPHSAYLNLHRSVSNFRSLFFQNSLTERLRKGRRRAVTESGRQGERLGRGASEKNAIRIGWGKQMVGRHRNIETAENGRESWKD